jgi:hypothetical protein
MVLDFPDNSMMSIFEVFYQPGKLFSSLAERRGAWVLPLLLNTLLLLAIGALVPHYIGRDNLMRQQLEGFNMTPEQKQTAIASAGSPARVYGGYVATAVSAPLIHAAIAGMLTIFGMMTSKAPKFGTMLSMVSLAFFPYWLVTASMTALILMMSPDPTTLDIRNLVATNVGAYMDKATLPKGIYSLLTSLDVLSFLEIGLLSLGFSKVTRSSIFAGFAAVGGLWVLYVSVKMLVSLLF